MHSFHRWRAVIQGAPDEKAVRRVMQEYVNSIDATVIAALPADCQQALQDRDIQAAAVALLHCELGFKGTPEMGDLLHEIAHTFAAASTRIARLSREPVGPSSE